MVQGEDTVVNDKSCQHDDTEEIDEIEFEATSGGQSEAPEDGGGTRQEDKQDLHGRAEGAQKAENQKRYDNDDGFGEAWASVYCDGKTKDVRRK